MWKRKKKNKVIQVEIQKIVIKDGVITNFIPGSNGQAINRQNAAGW